MVTVSLTKKELGWIIVLLRLYESPEISEKKEPLEDELFSFALADKLAQKEVRK
jgi:hypothetical protein